MGELVKELVKMPNWANEAAKPGVGVAGIIGTVGSDQLVDCWSATVDLDLLQLEVTQLDLQLDLRRLQAENAQMRTVQ